MTGCVRIFLYRTKAGNVMHVVASVFTNDLRKRRDKTMREKVRKEKKTREPRRKPKYGMLSCVAYMYRLLWKYEKGLVLAGIFNVPMTLVTSALALYTPSIILHVLETWEVFSYIALVAAGLVLADLFSSLLNNLIQNKEDFADSHILYQLTYQMDCRMLDRDFFLSYDPEIKKLDERACNAFFNNHTRAVNFPMEFSRMISIVLKFILFSSVISMLDPWILLLLAAASGINIPISAWERKRNYETQDSRNAIQKKFDYLVFQVGRDFKYGKDIRLYSLRGYLSLLAGKLLSEHAVEKKKVERRRTVVEVSDFLMVLLRDGLVYAYLIYRAVAGEIDAAQFVLYFSAVTAMADVMVGIRWWWSCVCDGALQVSDYREALEVPDVLNRGEGIPLPDGPFSIEFQNVSFHYPGEEKNVLEHISFRLEPGEKLALVGLNGAGKTTLTKLLCGLLLPTEGQILIDGHRVQEYNRDAFYTLFGLVPQNYHLLPQSIAQNIACTDQEDKIDRQRLEKSIRFAGLEEKISSLSLGADTPLNRQVNPEGIELSGGETQKLLLARLLYRSPRCIILDEPTAALDPLAEDRMYRRYHEIAEGATALFISHRLASTRFCDRIFLLDKAVIAEAGTHTELMAAGGKYRELFDVQSKYYKNP